jgi:hypothetical protein
MPVQVKGGIELRKAIKKFTPDLAKDTQAEMANLLRPIATKAKGFIPRNAPLSGWGKESINGKFPLWEGSTARSGVGYKTTPSKPNRQGFRALARIQNASASGAIYETAGRVNANGREQAKMREVVIPTYRRDTGAGEYRYMTSTNKKYGKSNNPQAGYIFVQAINQYSTIVDANNQTGAGRRSRKMKGRAIFRAWKEDGGKTNAAVIKAIESARDKFNAAVGYN